MALRRSALALPAALLLAACGGRETPADLIPRDKFVAANVAVRSLPDGATPEQRTAALRKHGVTDRQLKAWVAGHTREPEVLAKAWEEIAFKLDSTANPGNDPPPVSSPSPSGAPVPPPRPVGMGDSVQIAAPPPPPAAVGEPPSSRYPRRKRVQQVQ